MDILKFFSTSEERKKGYLRQRFITFLQKLNDYSENDVVLQLVDGFLLVVALHWPQDVVTLYGP